VRRGHRVLTVLLATALVVGGCSDDDDDDASEVRSERSSTTVRRSSTSTTGDLAAELAEAGDETEATADDGAGGSAGTRAGNRRAGSGSARPSGSAPGSTQAPPTTSACSRTSGSSGGLGLSGSGSPQVTVVNRHGGSVVVGTPAGSRTLGAGQSTTLTSLGAGQQRFTAAPANAPDKRFTFTATLVAGGSHELSVRTMQVSSCAGWVDMAQTNFSLRTTVSSTTPSTTATTAPSTTAAPPTDGGSGTDGGGGGATGP
jgi:hypothetical protein